MNSDTFELVRASRALGISATYVSQAEEAAKSFENRVKHLIQQVVRHPWHISSDSMSAISEQRSCQWSMTNAALVIYILTLYC